MLGRSSPRLGRKGMKDLGGWEAGETRGERRDASGYVELKTRRQGGSWAACVRWASSDL